MLSKIIYKSIMIQLLIMIQWLNYYYTTIYKYDILNHIYNIFLKKYLFYIYILFLHEYIWLLHKYIMYATASYSYTNVTQVWIFISRLTFFKIIITMNKLFIEQFFFLLTFHINKFLLLSVVHHNFSLLLYIIIKTSIKDKLKNFHIVLSLITTNHWLTVITVNIDTRVIITEWT